MKELQFTSREECTRAIGALEAQQLAVPAAWLEEKEIWDKLQDVTDDEYIFRTMWAYNKFSSDEKERTIRGLADHLLQEGDKAKEPCLLLGKVQCGKTDTFLHTMAMCFDRGIDVAVVMTKGTKTLTGQTLKRLNKDFKPFEDKNRRDQKVVIAIWDIMLLKNKGAEFVQHLLSPSRDGKRTKLIIVCKKQSKNIEHLNTLFDDCQMLRERHVLVCDDEADFSSRAYLRKKKNKNEREIELLKIADGIESLINKLPYYRYLQITATPYSLFLQPDGSIMLRDDKTVSAWLPRYTAIVPIHSHYIGGKQYFDDSQDENSMYSCLYHELDKDLLDILSGSNEFYANDPIHSDNMKGLVQALLTYIMSTAIRTLQEKEQTQDIYRSSCLLHCEIAQKEHAWQATLVDQIMNDIRQTIVDQNNADVYLERMCWDVYQDLERSNQLGNQEGLVKNLMMPGYNEVMDEVKNILGDFDYSIKTVNSEEPGKVASMMVDKEGDPQDGQLKLENVLNIFIGGSILDRGITISNLLCFIYGRDHKSEKAKFQMDAVLQHMRQYGARTKEDMSCTRFYTSQEIYDVLQEVNDIDEAMYNYLCHHQDKVQTNDFTSIVIGYSEDLKPTATNKIRISNTKVLKAYTRIKPVGFQTKPNIADKTAKIEQLLRSCPGYQIDEAEHRSDFFLMTQETAAQIIQLTAETYQYGEEFNNTEYAWNESEMLTALEYATLETNGNLWCRVYTNRDMSRERENIYDKRGRFVDSPSSADENRDQQRRATDAPLLALFMERGTKEKGWLGEKFYWPVLMMQKNLADGIFTLDANKKEKNAKQYHLKKAKELNPEDVLCLTLKKVFLFQILRGEKTEEYRKIENTNRFNYIKRDERGMYLLANGEVANAQDSVYSYNDGNFPFMVKDYKYLYLRTSRDYSGSQILVQLDEQMPYELVAEVEKECDRIHTREDEVYKVENNQRCKWTIVYHLGKVLESKLIGKDEEEFASL